MALRTKSTETTERTLPDGTVRQLKPYAPFKILRHFTETTPTAIFIKHEPAHSPNC
jgi:hypothetical protein